MKEERICHNTECDTTYFIYGDKIQKRVTRFNYCHKCRGNLDVVFLLCDGCNIRFSPTNTLQTYCSPSCKGRYSARKHYSRTRYSSKKKKNCKLCNMDMPYIEGKSRKKICNICLQAFFKRFEEMKCQVCQKSVESKMYCSKKCRAYGSLLLRRRKEDEVL